MDLKNLILKIMLSSLLLVVTACDNASRRTEHKDSVVVDLQNLAKSKESLEGNGIRLVKKKAPNGSETVEVSLENLENEISSARTASEAISYTKSAMSSVDEYIENSEAALKSRHLGKSEKKDIQVELIAVKEASEVMKSKLKGLERKVENETIRTEGDDSKKESDVSQLEVDQQSEASALTSDSKGSDSVEGDSESAVNTDKAAAAVGGTAAAVTALGVVAAGESSGDDRNTLTDDETSTEAEAETETETSTETETETETDVEASGETLSEEDKLKEYSYADLTEAIENKECSKISEIVFGIEIAMMLDEMNDSNRTLYDVENKLYAVAALEDKTCAKEITEALLGSKINNDVKQPMFEMLKDEVDLGEVLESETVSAQERNSVYVPDFEFLKAANFELFSEEPFPLGFAPADTSRTSYMPYLLSHIHTEEGMSADKVEGKMTEVLDKLYAAYPEETVEWLNSGSSFKGQSPFVAAAMYNETGIFKALSKVEGAKSNTVDKKTGYNSFEWQHVVNPYYMMNLNLPGVYADSEIKAILEESGLEPRTDVFEFTWWVGQNKGTQMSTKVDWIFTISNNHIEDMKSKWAESEYPFGNTTETTKLEYVPYKF